MDADGKMDVMIKKIWEHAETAQLLFFNCKTHTRIQTSICFSSLYNLRQAFNFKTTKIQTLCVFLFEERQNQRHTIGTHQPLSVGFETNVKWHGDGKQLHRYKEQDKAVNPEVC